MWWQWTYVICGIEAIVGFIFCSHLLDSKHDTWSMLFNHFIWNNDTDVIVLLLFLVVLSLGIFLTIPIINNILVFLIVAHLYLYIYKEEYK